MLEAPGIDPLGEAAGQVREPGPPTLTSISPRRPLSSNHHPQPRSSQSQTSSPQQSWWTRSPCLQLPTWLLHQKYFKFHPTPSSSPLPAPHHQSTVCTEGAIRQALPSPPPSSPAALAPGPCGLYGKTLLVFLPGSIHRGLLLAQPRAVPVEALTHPSHRKGRSTC